LMNGIVRVRSNQLYSRSGTIAAMETTGQVRFDCDKGLLRPLVFAPTSTATLDTDRLVQHVSWTSRNELGACKDVFSMALNIETNAITRNTCEITGGSHQ